MLRKTVLYKDTLRAGRGHSAERVAAMQAAQQARWSQDKGKNSAMYEPMADVIGDGDIPAVTFNHAANIALVQGLLQMANAPAVIRPSFIGICFAFLLLRSVGGSVTENDWRELIKDGPVLTDEVMNGNAPVDYSRDFSLVPSAPQNGVAVGSAEWHKLHDEVVDSQLREFTIMRQHANAAHLLEEHRLKLQQQGKQFGDDYAMRLMAHTWFLQQEHSYAAILNSSVALDVAQPIVLPPREHVWPMDVLQTFNGFLDEERKLIDYAARSDISEVHVSELINDIDMLIGVRDQNDLHHNMAILELHKIALRLWARRIFEINQPIMLQDFLRAKKSAQCIVGLTDGLAKYPEGMLEICRKLNTIQEHILRSVRDNIWADASRYADQRSIVAPIAELNGAVMREVRIDTTIGELKQIFAQYWQKQAAEAAALNARVWYGITAIAGVVFAIFGWRHRELLFRKIRGLWHYWQHWADCKKNLQLYANMLSCAANKHLAEIKSTAIVAEISVQELVGKVIAGILKQQKLSNINVAVRELAVGIVISLRFSGGTSVLRYLLSNTKQAAVEVSIVQYLNNLRDKISESKKQPDVQSAVSTCKYVPSDCGGVTSSVDVAAYTADSGMAQVAKIASSKAQEAFGRELEEVCLIVQKLHASIVELLEFTNRIRAIMNAHAVLLNEEDAAIMNEIEGCSRNCAVLFTSYINDKSAQIFKINPRKLTSQQLRQAMQDTFIEVANVVASLMRYDMAIHAANKHRNGKNANIESAELARMFRVRSKYLEFTNVKQRIQKICVTLESTVEARAKQERKAQLRQEKQRLREMQTAATEAASAASSVTIDRQIDALPVYVREIHNCFVSAGDSLNRLQQPTSSHWSEQFMEISYIGELNALRFYMMRTVVLMLQYSSELRFPPEMFAELCKARLMLAHCSHAVIVEDFIEMHARLNLYDAMLMSGGVADRNRQCFGGIGLWQTSQKREESLIVIWLRDALQNTFENVVALINACDSQDASIIAVRSVLQNYIFYSVYNIGASFHELEIIVQNEQNKYSSSIIGNAREVKNLLYAKNETFCRACVNLRNYFAHGNELYAGGAVKIADILVVMGKDYRAKNVYAFLQWCLSDLPRLRNAVCAIVRQPQPVSGGALNPDAPVFVPRGAILS